MRLLGQRPMMPGRNFAILDLCIPLRFSVFSLVIPHERLPFGLRLCFAPVLRHASVHVLPFLRKGTNYGGNSI